MDPNLHFFNLKFIPLLYILDSNLIFSIFLIEGGMICLLHARVYEDELKKKFGFLRKVWFNAFGQEKLR